MTQYPEAFLARELGMCYVNISLITDYDVGLDDAAAPVSAAAVFAVMEAINDALRGLLHRLVSDPRRAVGADVREKAASARRQAVSRRRHQEPIASATLTSTTMASARNRPEA